jgi:hypothetical protein
MKVVMNSCYGGFSLSEQGKDLYLNKKGLKFSKEKSQYFSLVGYDYHVEGNEYWYERDIERNDPVLVEVVEELGEKSFGSCAELRVVEIPDGVDWQIEEYDGLEHVAEVHRTWY